MKKPILVVTSHFIKPIEARIEKEYEVRRKTDGTLFTRDELLAAAEGAEAILITPFDTAECRRVRRGKASRYRTARQAGGHKQVVEAIEGDL